MSAAVEIDDDEDDFEIEIEDDTPEEDRGRSVASDDDNDNDEIDDEELKNYSAGAAKRIKTLTRKRHDERRRGDEKDRQLNEALSLVQKLRGQLGGAAKAVVSRDKDALTVELDVAKKDMAAAIETGDGAKAAELSEKISDIRGKLNGAVRAEKDIESSVEQNANEDTANPADQSKWPKARKDWYKKNQEWFHKDEEMTGYVYGLHQKLIKNGVAPDSEEYYEQIDTKMRKVFPDQFEDNEDEDEDETPKPRRAEPKVARVEGGATAKTNSKGKKVYKLTKSQQDLCKRLNITPKQYIEEQLALGND